MIACDASLSTLDKAKPSSSSSIDDLPAQVELDRLEKERAKPFMKMIGIGIILMVPLLATICAYYLPDFIDNLILPKPPSPETSSGQPRQWGPYNDSDCSADGSTSRSYNLHVADEILVDLNNRLRSPCLVVSLNSIRLYK